MKYFFVFIIGVVYSYTKIPLKSKYSTEYNIKSRELFSSYKIPTMNYENLQYYITLDFGTPAQSFSLVLDTGSSWTWIPSIDCTSCNVSSKFDKTMSSSYIGSRIIEHVYYGKGSVVGEISKETISADNLIVKGQDFILTYNDIDNFVSDGLLGLGFNKLSRWYPTFIENLKSQGQIESSLFSIYLSNQFIPTTDSVFIIGGYDLAYAQGQNTTIKILKDFGLWATTTNLLKIKDQNFEHNALVFLDIGTSYLLGPVREIDSIINMIMLSANCVYQENEWICNCNSDNLDNFPNLEFLIDNNTYVITPHSYLYPENEKCFVLLGYSRGAVWVFGQVFFREYYSVYDMDNFEVYLYPSINNKEIKSSIVYNYYILIIIKSDKWIIYVYILLKIFFNILIKK